MKVTLVQLFDDSDPGHDPLVQYIFEGHLTDEALETAVHDNLVRAGNSDEMVQAAMNETGITWAVTQTTTQKAQ